MSTTVVVTAKGDEVVSGRMIGTSPTQAEPKQAAWGTGGVGGPYQAAKSDVGMFAESPETRVASTTSQVTTTTTDDTYQAVGTFTSLGTQTVTEWGLFDSGTKPASTTVTGGSAVGSSSGTTLTVASAAGFPGSGTYDVQVRSEVLTVTGGQGTTSWTVTRGQNGSTATATIANGDGVTGGNPPGSTAVAGGSMCVHASFAGLPLAANDQLTGTVKVAFN